VAGALLTFRSTQVCRSANKNNHWLYNDEYSRTCTVISGLSVTWLAPTLVRPVGVDAQLLANVLASSALVQVPASGVVGVQQVSGGTAARVTAFQILTRHFARRRVEQAFVYICGT